MSPFGRCCGGRHVLQHGRIIQSREDFALDGTGIINAKAQGRSAASRNKGNGTTDFTDFTDSEFSFLAATGKKSQQKQTKTTK